ncbi:MAG: nucleotidyltransferase family protein [Methanobacteriota archaeon]
MLTQHQKEIQQYGVKRIGLFGSYTTNNHHRKSDIDILVEFQKGKKTFDNYMELKFFLEKLFNRPVDLVVKEALKLELKPSILKSVRYATGF